MKPVVPLLLLFLLLVAYSCKDAGVKQRPMMEKSVPYPEESILKEITRLGDVIYDAPDSCLNHPDSFLLSLKQLPKTKEGKVMYTYLLLNMAYLLREQGRVLPGIRFYEKALAYYRENELTSIDFYDYIVKPLGSLYTITGDFEKATALQYLAVTTAERENRTDVLPALYGNLAITLQQTDQYDSVLLLCRRGLFYSQGEHLVSARLYNEMAKCFFSQQQIDSAQVYNNKSLALFEEKTCTGDTIIWFSAALMLQSDLARYKEDFSTALRAIDKAISLTEKNYPQSKNREKAKFYEQRAELLLGLGQMVRSNQDFERVLALFLPQKKGFIFADNTVTDALLGLGRSYTKLGQSDSAIFYYTRAIENDYVVQGAIVNRESNYFNSRHNRVVLQEVMDLIWSQYIQADANRKNALALLMLWNTELSKGRQLLMEIERTNRWQKDTTAGQQRAAKQKLRYLFDVMAEETDTQKLRQLKAEIHEIAFAFQLSEQYFEQQTKVPDFDQFRKDIKEIAGDKDVLCWQLQEKGNSYGITVSADQTVAFQISGVVLQNVNINAFLQSYFQNGPEVFNDNPGQYKKISEDILKILIPGKATLKRKDWILSPDGILYALPIDALCTQGHFLVQEKNIAYTYTLLMNTQERSTQPYHSGISVFSKSTHQGGLTELRYVQEESRVICSDYKANLFRDEAANDKAFMEAMNTNSILHVATHAVVDNTTQPYLALASKLTLDKIQYTASRSPLVVLTACQTASGKWITAEGRESLNRAFLSKGVKGVIASQWPVNDAAMPLMVDLFYRELYRTHVPEIAVAHAKRAFLKQARSPQMCNPWYWASLSYTGVSTEIIISQKTKYRQLLLSGLLLVSLAFAGYLFYRKGKGRH